MLIFLALVVLVALVVIWLWSDGVLRRKLRTYFMLRRWRERR
jgi:hypothetical protein